MKHDPAAFQSATYTAVPRELVEDRVRRFLPMVRRAAWHIYGMGREGLEVEDLIQAGILALTECAQKHEAPTEDGFAAYAKIRVRGAMLDQIRKLMNDTRSARKKRAQYAQVVEKIAETWMSLTGIFNSHLIMSACVTRMGTEEQKRRFDARQEAPHKRWKLTDEDWRNRSQWNNYRIAAHEMIQKTNTAVTPWSLI